MARKYIKESKQAKQLALDSGCTALYIRVSTELQASEGYSLDAQQKQLEAFCTAHGWTVCPDHIYIDAGLSGKTSDRPHFQAMLQAAHAGTIQRIVAAKLDRLARNVKDFLTLVDQLKQWECNLVLIKESFDTGTPQGKFALTMFAAMAELEASTITERVMTGKRQKASEGGYNGSRCPLGYIYANGQFATTERAGTVASMFDHFDAGLSLNAITRHLNNTGTPTATGSGQWSVNGVKHILSNGAYAGISQWDGTEAHAGNYPPIISKELYDRCQARLQGLSRGQRVDLCS